MPPLKIPESDYAGLSALVALKDESMKELVAALSEAPPSSDSHALAAVISSQTATISSDIAAILAKVIISLNVGRAYLDYSVPEFAKAICNSLEETGLETLRLLDDRERFEKNLARVLSVEGISATIKAQAVLHEYEHILCNARVLTDLRPIFGSSSLDTPAGMGIVHTLRVRYHQGETVKDFFVVMDGEELEELAEIIERAKTKSASLRSVLSKAGIPEITT